MSLAHWNDIMELCVEESVGVTATPIEVISQESTDELKERDWQILIRY